MQAEHDKFVWLFNIGTIRNRYKLRADADAKRGTINRVSAAVLYRLPWGSTLIADLGQADAESTFVQKKSKFYVLGVIHAVNKDLDLDVGYKKGISDVETDRQWGVGLTWRFARI